MLLNAPRRTHHARQGASTTAVRGRIVGALLAVAALLAAPGVAAADSIVHLRNGDIWLTSPDGNRAYQVTFDGGWDSPSQADDGTIVAIKGTRLVRLTRSGEVIGTPVAAAGGSTGSTLGEAWKLFGPFDAQVSPDGRQIAYWATAYTTSSTGQVIWTDFRDVTLVTPSDRAELPRENWITSVRTPSWATNDRLLVAGSGVGNMDFETWLPGFATDGALQWWFRNVNAISSDAELSPDGRRLVAVAQTNGALSAPNTVHVYAVPGPAWTPAPYPDTWKDDAIRPPEAESRCQGVRDSDVHSPSWSPSSTAIAYDDKDGIWVQDLPDLSDCGRVAERLLVPGGAHPDWGPADVDLAQAPRRQGAAPPAAPGDGPAAPAGPAPAGPGPASQQAPVLGGVSVPARARRSAGLRVRLALRAPSRVTIALCRAAGRRCTPTRVRRTLTARAGTTAVSLDVRRLRAGRYRISVTPAGGEAVVKQVQIV